MRLIDADKFLAYLIYSKHIDSLTCGEVKEVIKMCEVDVLNKIKAEIIEERKGYPPSADEYKTFNKVLQIINKHIGEQNE